MYCSGIALAIATTIACSLVRPALVDIVLVLAARRTEYSVGMVRRIRLLAVLADAQRLLPVSQHEAEHHLNAQQQRMKIPYDGRLIEERNVVCRRDSAECRHALTVNTSRRFIKLIVILVIERACCEGKCPIAELSQRPIVALGVFPLQAHASLCSCYWLYIDRVRYPLLLHYLLLLSP